MRYFILGLGCIAALGAMILSVSGCGGSDSGSSIADSEIAYIADRDGHRVVLVGAQSGRHYGAIGVGDEPEALIGTADGSRVYVANYSSGTVSVIDTAARRVVATIPVGNAPHGMALHPDGGHLYVVNLGDDVVDGKLRVIDTATNMVLKTVTSSSNLSSITVHPSGSYAMLTGQNPSALMKFDLPTETITQTYAATGGPKDLAFNPAGTRAYATLYMEDRLAVFDTADFSTVQTVSVGVRPYRVAVAGGKVYVTNSDSLSVSVVNASTYAVSTLVVGGTPIGLTVSPDGQTIYVVTRYDRDMALIDAVTDGVDWIRDVATGPQDIILLPK